ncbi:MAG TPA: LLM class flavin-dependent oxidoreductase [Propionibacteriaceae bacterium]|nr:LLM class flavin-dependent oxidoreductase [Propionibacteriaceae bacterium]
MKIGIGLPNPVPETPGHVIIDWAKRAEAAGFSGLVTIDRIAYPSYDSLATHAAAAGATERISLMTNILLAPIYTPVLLAKTAASIDQISSGRFTLGLAAGGRQDDYEVTGRNFRHRGRDFDNLLEVMHKAWRGEPLAEDSNPASPTPTQDQRVPILFGGTTEKTIERIVTWGAGWTAGGAPPSQAAPDAERVRSAWSEAGRSGEPRLSALNYFSLGDDAEQLSRQYLFDYYRFAGDFAPRIAESAHRSASQVREVAKMFEDAGFTEMYFDPTVATLDQVDRLADAVL